MMHAVAMKNVTERWRWYIGNSLVNLAIIPSSLTFKMPPSHLLSTLQSLIWISNYLIDFYVTTSLWSWKNSSLVANL